MSTIETGRRQGRQNAANTYNTTTAGIHLPVDDIFVPLSVFIKVRARIAETFQFLMRIGEKALNVPGPGELPLTRPLLNAPLAITLQQTTHKTLHNEQSRK